MGHAHHAHADHVQVLPPDKNKIRTIWMTTLYLAIATAIEFALAFLMERGTLLTSIFVVLTFFKTYFIVGEFMHLKHEVKSLIIAIVSPVVFIIWLIVAMLYESSHVLAFIHMYWPK